MTMILLQFNKCSRLLGRTVNYRQYYKKALTLNRTLNNGNNPCNKILSKIHSELNSNWKTNKSLFPSVSKFNFIARRSYQISEKKDPIHVDEQPGSLAFADCEFEAIADLFYQFANRGNSSAGGVDELGSYLCINGVKDLLESIGERPDEETLQQLFYLNDVNKDGKLHFEEFLLAADKVLGGKPAGIVLVVGGPGSGKGVLCDRLAAECGSVHLSSGELLRDEVAAGTPLGIQCKEIMDNGELVSSAVITALVRRRMRKFPKRRVILDGFPRSLENAHDFIQLCGKPEVALHLDCDDTILMERILTRAKNSIMNGEVRTDDNFETALLRLRTFHKYHQPTIDWLREQGVPIVNLDCSGTPQNVWNQLVAIARLMRPAVAYNDDVQKAKAKQNIFDIDDQPSTKSGV